MASNGVENLELSGEKNHGAAAGGYDIQQFVELPPKDLICTKCEKVLREPHQAECGHLYCGQCISATEECPCYCCGRNLRSRAYSKDYQRDGRIRELMVRCPERGCQWEGELQNLETHRKEQCAYIVVECEFRYAGCMTCGIAREMREHMENDVQQHLYFVAKYFQSQLEQQMSHGRERSASIVAVAPQEVFEERETHQHEQRTVDEHVGRQEEWREARLEERQAHVLPRVNIFGLLILVTVFVAMLAIAYQHGASSLSNRVLSLKAEIDDVTHKLESLQAQLNSDIKKLEASGGHNWKALETKYRYDNLSNKYMALANSTEASVTSFRAEMREILLQIQDQNQILNEEKVKQRNTAKRIEKVEKVLRKVEPKVNSTDIRVMKIEAEGLHTSETSAIYRILPLEIALPVSQLAVWQSAPFYSHLRGYKMHVLINGTSSHAQSNLRQKRLGVYIQIEPGEFDGTLSWPSDLELTVHLLHPKGDHYQPEQSIRLVSFPNGQSGWDEYISPEKVKQYITSNLLHFKIFKLL